MGGQRFPIGFAHRGGRGPAAGNTLGAFTAALQAGAKGLESDVWLTADGVPVLDHDGKIRHRRWLPRRAIRRVARDLLPQRICTLAELYQVCGCDFELSLDIRDPAAVPAVIALANQWQAASRLWLVGRCDQAASWKSVDEAVNPVCETRDFSPARLRALREAGLSAVNLPYRSWTTKAVSGVHAAGLLAFGWRADSARRIARLLALGCDGVYSDSLSALEGAGLTRSSARRCSGRQGD